MANLSINANNQWSGEALLVHPSSQITLPTGGKYVDKDIVLKLTVQNATFKVAESLTDDWTPYVPVYEVETAGYVAAGKQGELNIEWNSF